MLASLSMKLLGGLLLLLAIVVITIGVVALAIHAMVKERGTHGTSGALSSAALEVQSMLEPSRRNVLEAKRAQEETEESDESGDPP